MMMKRTMAFAAAAAAALQAAALSLADASSKIAEAAADPSVMAGTVAQLDAADQVAFLAKVNAAIDAMPGSPEEKAAKYLDANKAAMKSAAKGNLAALLAETFATVPPEALTVVNERFAADLFNRSADAANPIDDKQMLILATNAMAVVQARNEGNDNESVRNTFAILMFLRASNGSPEGLKDALVAGLGSTEARDLAANDWIPAAMGEGREKSYEPMLAASDAARLPVFDDIYAFSLTSDPVFSGALLANLGSSVGSSSSAAASAAVAAALDPTRFGLPMEMTQSGMSAKPATLDDSARYYGGYRRGSGDKGSNQAEPGAYPFQTSR